MGFFFFKKKACLSEHKKEWKRFLLFALLCSDILTLSVYIRFRVCWSFFLPVKVVFRLAACLSLSFTFTFNDFFKVFDIFFFKVTSPLPPKFRKHSQDAGSCQIKC
eukprot:TRINITY_DN9908_c0_g1_i1.p1 TRINITY_DN9908_c0_g1~~TRINITY_DN9908_c0_g1_i1.p1  ORF type:complete len:106 (+),score=6.37 TRINITY_DN9908_c0_g1_i1:275-592(+)